MSEITQKGICQECGKEYEYVFNPKFPRKYCQECSAIKKAQFEGVQRIAPIEIQPVNAPVQKIDPVVNPSKTATMYTSYAKDIFVALLDHKATMVTAEQIVSETLAPAIMTEAIDLVKQAREAFE